MNYINGYLNYTGSKFKLLDQLLPLMDYTKDNFVDLFCGSAVVTFNVVDKFKSLLANDIISELIDIHANVLQSNEIIIRTKQICPNKSDKEAFLALRDKFNRERLPEQLWALILCCNSNLMRFNKQFNFNQTHGLRSWNSSTEEKINNFITHIRPYKNKIKFISKHFNDVDIDANSFYYIDSPYTGSSAGYNCYWNANDDDLLYDYCHKLNTIGATFMLSGILGEHKKNIRWELIDKLIADGFTYKILDCNYEKVAKIKNEKESQEIIIMNYDRL